MDPSEFCLNRRQTYLSEKMKHDLADLVPRLVRSGHCKKIWVFDSNQHHVLSWNCHYLLMSWR